MASPRSTAIHCALPRIPHSGLKKQQMALDQLAKENLALKEKIYHLEVEKSKRGSFSDRITQTTERDDQLEDIKKELAEKELLLVQATSIIYQRETQVEALKLELNNSFRKEEFKALDRQVKSLMEQLMEKESNVNEALQNVESAHSALEIEKEVNLKLQVELERFNDEFCSRLQSLEQELLSQKLVPLTDLETRSVQTDECTAVYENQILELEKRLQMKDDELKTVACKTEAHFQHAVELEGQVEQLQNFLRHSNKGIEDLACQAEELKTNLAENQERNKKIQELEQKLGQAETRIREMEVETMIEEKKTENLSKLLMEHEKEKLDVQRYLQEMEEALMVSEAKFQQASEDRNKHVKSLELMQLEIEDLSSHYDQTVHPDQNEALAAKDDIIAQLHEEIDNLHAKLKEKNDLIGDIITRRLEMAESESNNHSQNTGHEHEEEYIKRKEQELLVQLREAEQCLLEKEEDLFFTDESLQKSKKELAVALADMSFYQDLACQLQKELIPHLSFVQDIRKVASSNVDAKGQRSVEEHLTKILYKLDVRLKTHSQLDQELTKKEEQSSVEGTAGRSQSSFLSSDQEKVECEKCKTMSGDVKSRGIVRRNSSGLSYKSQDTAQSLSDGFSEGASHSEFISSHSTSSTDGSRRSCWSSLSKYCLLKSTMPVDLSKLESCVQRALFSPSSQECHVIEDILSYLTSQYQGTGDGQYRLDKLEENQSEYEELGPQTCNPISGQMLDSGHGTIPLANANDNRKSVTFHASIPSSSSSSTSSATNRASSHASIQGSMVARSQLVTKTTSGCLPQVMAARKNALNNRSCNDGVAGNNLKIVVAKEDRDERLNIEFS